MSNFVVGTFEKEFTFTAASMNVVDGILYIITDSGRIAAAFTSWEYIYIPDKLENLTVEKNA